MLKIEWRNGLGWSNPQIIPSGPIALHPFAHVFHYANECYEGMKAYIDANGNVRMFRPEKNMERLNFIQSIPTNSLFYQLYTQPIELYKKLYNKNNMINMEDLNDDINYIFEEFNKTC